MKKTTLGVALAISLFAGNAEAQTIEELRALATGRSAELNEYRLLLQDAAIPEQVIMVRSLLASEDRELRQIAQSHALFSASASLRLEALRAILNQKSTLLVQLTDLTDRTLIEAVRAFGGAYSTEEAIGSYSFSVRDPTSADCWGTRGMTQRDCEVEIVGDQVFFSYDGNGWSYQGQLTMTQSGTLEGAIRYREGNPASVVIDLKQR